MRRLIGALGASLALVCWAHAAGDVKDLVMQLKDKDPDVRRTAAKQLAESGADAREAAPDLIKALKDEDFYVRRFAAQALGAVGADPRTAVPALEALLKDRNEKKEVQEAAAQALGKMGAAGVAVLRTVLKDANREPVVRRRAAQSLGEIGPDARPALPDLTDVVNGKVEGGKKADPNAAARDIRLEAVEALGNIANAKDETIISALEAIAADKGNKKNKALVQAVKLAVVKIKNRTASLDRAPSGQALTFHAQDAYLGEEARARGRRAERSLS
jgi:HEAT repeat protein